MGQYKKHVFVCTYGAYCPYDGDTEALIKALKQRVAAAGLSQEIRINRAGCLNQCGHGPNVVVYPDDVWYAGVQAGDAEEIFKSHLVGDCPVTRLLYQALPGNHKRTDGYPPEVYEAEQQDKRALKDRARAQAEVRRNRDQG